jgi:large subunit ribosomal protein L10
MNVVEAEITHAEELAGLSREPRPDKVAEVERLKKVIEESRGIFLTDFRGIDVERMNELRTRFRDRGIEYRIVKNNLLKRAADGVGLGDWISDLVGPTAMAVCVDDAIAPARVIKEFRDAYRREEGLLAFKGGLLAGEIIDEQTFQRLSTLPGRDELIARLLYLLTYPMRGLVTVLSGLPRNLVYALEDLRKTRAETVVADTEAAPQEEVTDAPDGTDEAEAADEPEEAEAAESAGGEEQTGESDSDAEQEAPEEGSDEN